MITKEQIRKLSNAISNKFKVNKIFLFGSYAYGNPTWGSDLDLCIVTNLGRTRKIELTREIRREIKGFLPISMDILLYDDKEFQKRSSLQNTLEYQILHQGILLNGKY